MQSFASINWNSDYIAFCPSPLNQTSNCVRHFTEKPNSRSDESSITQMSESTNSGVDLSLRLQIDDIAIWTWTVHTPYRMKHCPGNFQRCAVLASISQREKLINLYLPIFLSFFQQQLLNVGTLEGYSWKKYEIRRSFTQLSNKTSRED